MQPEQSPSKDGGFDFRRKPTKDIKGIIDLIHLEDGGFNHLEDYKMIVYQKVARLELKLRNLIPQTTFFILDCLLCLSVRLP